MATPLPRYDFVRQVDDAWTWQRTNRDGSTTRLSARHESAGTIMADAVASGFRPSVHYWLVDDDHTVSYFEPGNLPKTLNKLDILLDTDSGGEVGLPYAETASPTRVVRR